MAIFHNLEADEKRLNTEKKGEVWIEIGFQGEDPSTDFRGTGELGLLNLYFFTSSQTEEALKICQESRIKGQDYFFACCGINISFYILNLLKNNNSLGFENVNNKNDAILRFNKIYCRVFSKFHQYWITSELRHNIMNFNICLKEFFLQNPFELIN